MVSDKAEKKHLQLTTDIEASVPPRLAGDAARLEQALFNLVDNAIKFMDSGEIRIGLRLLERDDQRALLKFEVIDTGIGIEPDALTLLLSDAHLFEQLDSTAARRFGGLGVGLAHARELAKLMGGQLGAESTPGQGSTFWFSAWLRVCS